MTKRTVIIPGVDPEVAVHGKLPSRGEVVPSRGIKCTDLRDDVTAFGEDNAGLVDRIAERMSRDWFRFSCAGCSIDDAEVYRGVVFTKNLPVVGITNRVSHDVSASRDNPYSRLKPTSEVPYYPGNTVYLNGRGANNYYHYIADVISFVEAIYENNSVGEFDRIVLPYTGKEGDFQRQMIIALYPELWDKFVFDRGSFRAEHLTFCFLRPDYYFHDENTGELGRARESGVSRRGYYGGCLSSFFGRVDKIYPDGLTSNEDGIVLISRERATGRKIINESELFSALAPLGARRVILEELSIREQIKLMRSTRVLVGPHGAGMINAGFCQQGATAIEITGRLYLQRAPDFAKLALCRGIKYEFAVCDEHGDIERLVGNRGNDILLGDRAIRYLTEVVSEALC